MSKAKNIPGAEAAEQIKAQFDQYLKAGQESMAKNMEQALHNAREQLGKMTGQTQFGFSELNSISRDNVEAYMRSAELLTRGAEQLGKAWMAYAQTAAELTQSMSQAALRVKTMQDLSQLQNEFSKNGLDQLIAETSKLTDLSVKVTSEAIEPISERMHALIDRMGKQNAA